MSESLEGRKVLVEQRDEIGYSQDVFEFADVLEAAARQLAAGKTDVTVQPDPDDEGSFYRARLLPGGFEGWRVDAARAAVTGAG